MAKIIKVTGYLLAHDDVDENEIALAAGDVLSDKFDCIDKPFATESAPLEVSFFDEEWNDHPLNRIDCPVEICEQYFENKIQVRPAATHRVLCMGGHEFVPGDVIDYLKWSLDEDIFDEAYGPILRDVSDCGIVVFDVVAGADVWIPEKNIVVAEHENYYRGLNENIRRMETIREVVKEKQEVER